MFDWDENNRRKLKAHRVTTADVEQALSQAPILVYEQEAHDEVRYVYYGETKRGRLLAIVLTERADKIRVITAYTLDAGQKRDYLERRARGE
ncbi:MAG TPA: BrnT family toxin [Bryobacteraceae bacterium]|nr:BrnT family toxin [Bryobacteraceae bacterium]